LNHKSNHIRHSNTDIDNIWNFSKLKHEERDDPANLKLEVSKLTNKVSYTTPYFCFEIKEAYLFAEVQQITMEVTSNLKTHDENIFHQQACTCIQRLCAIPKSLTRSTQQPLLPEQCGKEKI
jgi:hypothetical protein